MASLKIIEYLLDHGAIITGSGAIHKAAEKGRIDVLEMFLQHGADLNEYWSGQLTTGRDFRGGTPLHMAVSHDQVQTVKWLLEHGADPNIKK
jgi:ankyrin repeat protein